MEKGKVIVLDGLDGCGKSTQFEAVTAILQEKNIPAKPISFPVYGKPSAALVEMYLNGEFSETPGGVNAYAASSFYAVDRYANYILDWKVDYDAGKLILASRYTTSNAVHQMSKLPRKKWSDFLHWLETYEYDLLGLPRPDLVLYLSMPIDQSLSLLSKRYHADESAKDIHESDRAYLESCAEAAEFAGKQWHWQKITCGDENQIFSVPSIRDKIVREIEKVLARKDES